MTAGLLREAAALMRERAEVFEFHSSAWRTEPAAAGWSEIRSSGSIVFDGKSVTHDTYVCQMDTSSTAEHIASWHPAVALAVAAWLDALSDAMTNPDAPNGGIATLREEKAALAVARAYLGRDS